MSSDILKMGAPIVVAFGVLVAILCFFAPAYGAAVLAIGLSLAVAAIFSAFQSILLKIEDLERKVEQNMVSFNEEESREFVDAVESAYKRPAVEATLPPPATPPPAPSAITPPISAHEPPSVVTKAFEAPLSPPPRPMEQFEKTLDHSGPPVTIQQPIPLQESVSLETTQSFMPKEGQPRLGTVSPQENLNPAETIGFGAAPAGFSKTPSNPGVQIPPPLPASLTGIEESKPRKAAGRRRYSTFAGLSLSANSGPLRTVQSEPSTPAQEAVKNLGTMAPPPPPTKPREKERRRYSTFAGLSLSDRGGRTERPAPPPPPPPAPFSIPGRLEPPQGEFAEYFKPSPNDPPVSGSGNFEEYFRPSPGETPYAPPKQSNLDSGMMKGSRKRYQTFMGLSLSKTPPAMKKLPDPAEAGTAPLPPSYEQSYSQAPQKGTQINKGQVGSLVDGFCSLCGSPQAAGKNLEDTLSTPEFCWYCGAKLKF